MKSKTIRFFSFLFPCLLACSIGHAYEQDNWYLANEWGGLSTSQQGPAQVFYQEDSLSDNGKIYIADSGANKVQVFETNGSKIFEIPNLSRVKGITVDENGTIFCLFSGGFKSFDENGTLLKTLGTSGSGNSQFSIGAQMYSWDPQGALAIHPITKNIYALDAGNDRVQVFDQNGSFLFKFGVSGTAPGQLNDPLDMAFLSDNRLIITDDSSMSYFDENGTFLDRNENGQKSIVVSPDGTILLFTPYYQNNQKLITTDNQTISSSSSLPGGNRGVFTPDGDLILSKKNGNIQIWKRAFRTKGMPVPNVIPQPAIRSVSQRSGTNILDLDFEIIDSDDATATVGILAYAEGTRILPSPQALIDGSIWKIGVPIATNQVHRVSWDVKQDWNTSTGEIKFEILCQDANRTMPVDLHFLTLPLPDGNLTISRSPLKDSDYLNFFKYQVGTQSNEVAWDASTNSWTDGNSTAYMNTNNQVTADGRNYLMSKLGYRYATTAEVTKAKEAATPGSVNRWSASRRIRPRNLPATVNEYGFDSYDHGSRAWWVVKE